MIIMVLSKIIVVFICDYSYRVFYIISICDHRWLHHTSGRLCLDLADALRSTLASALRPTAVNVGQLCPAIAQLLSPLRYDRGRVLSSSTFLA